MDLQLRRLQRQAAQGDPGARARVLRERLRAGKLADDQLRLAAYLGAEGPQEGVAAPRELPMEGWVRGLASWGRQPLLRAGLAILRGSLEARSGLPDRPQEATLKALALAEASLGPDVGPTQSWWIQEELQAVGVLADGVDQDLAWMASELLSAMSADDAARACDHVAEVVRLTRRLLSEQATRHAIREALLPWVLGER